MGNSECSGTERQRLREARTAVHRVKPRHVSMRGGERVPQTCTSWRRGAASLLLSFTAHRQESGRAAAGLTTRSVKQKREPNSVALFKMEFCGNCQS